jgi:3-methyl-2-oxobutanoate hydroxymethyltransferase
MDAGLTRRFTLSDLRAARDSGRKVAMLTCYDYTTARLMQEAGVPALLVGDSAANVILGHDSTLPVPLDFMIQITGAVRRGAPLALVVADMPFGSYQQSDEQGVANILRMAKESGCDCVKIEAARTHLRMIGRLADAGVAVMAHLGLRPQTVGLMGGYKCQGRTAQQGAQIVASALRMEDAGAAAILLEAVPPEVAAAVVERTTVPVIGCGAGPACHGCVIVTHDGVGLTPAPPRFAPRLGDLAAPMRRAYGRYVADVVAQRYPAAEHAYAMLPGEARKLRSAIRRMIGTKRK